MIKQAIGILTTVAVLVVVALTLLHHDRYSTMLRFGEPLEQAAPVRETLPSSVPTVSGEETVIVDSLSGTPGLSDMPGE